MAEIKGKKLICDRCGESVFLQCVGEGELDGGFTRWNKFEPDPKGWAWHIEIGKLCPSCNEEYNKLINAFKERIDRRSNNAE